MAENDLEIRATMDSSAVEAKVDRLSQALQTASRQAAGAEGALKLAAVAASINGVIHTVQRLGQAIGDIQRQDLNDVFGGIKQLADKTDEAFRALNERLERTESHLRAVADLVAAGADFKLRLDLAAIERDRQSKLDALDPNAEDYNFRAGEINREADTNALYARYYAAKGALGKETQSEIDANKREQAAILARKDQIKGRMAARGLEIQDLSAGEDNPLVRFGRKFGEFWGLVNKSPEADKLGAEDEKDAAELAELAEKLKGLVQAEKDLKAKRDLETGQGGQALYEELQAPLEKIGVAARMDFKKEHGAADKVEEEEKAEKLRRGSSANYLTDSLARIGGYVGAAATDRTAERAQRERENQTRILQTIERNTRNGGTAVLA